MIILIALAYNYHVNQAYKFSDAELRLLSKTSVDKSKITYKDGKLSYNRDSESTVGGQKITVSSATNSTGKMPYKVTLASMASEGIEFSDSTNDLPFKVIPASATGEGRYINNRMVYRVKGGKGVYTLRRNGIKEDIILTKAPGDSVTYKWKLELGDKLKAKMLHNGSVGIYSADPLLSSSSLQVSDAKSQSLIDNARKNGKKTYLQYLIPRPYFKDGQGKLSAGGVGFSLSGNVLTLTATDLKDKKYPLSIDPTVVTTTTADFATGYDDGNIDYSTADEIGRAGIGTGLAGTWNYTGGSSSCSSWAAPCSTAGNSLLHPLDGHSSVTYDGYIYVVGGLGPASTGDCNSAGYCNGTQYAPINADGTIGTWKYTGGSSSCSSWAAPCSTAGNSFSTPRAYHTSVVYNGYLYVMGGYVGPGNTDDCNNSGACNGTQYAPINADGTIGTWKYTGGSSSCSSWAAPCSTAGNSLLHPLDGHSSVTYDGYIYVVGGTTSVGTDDCGTGNCNGTEYAPINADGTIGTWKYTGGSSSCSSWAAPCSTAGNSFSTPRAYHTSVVYNGYLYVMGGSGSSNDCSTYCNGTQYAPINANGTVGSWNYTGGGSSCSTWISPCSTAGNSFRASRNSFASVAYNGYLYVIGGSDGATTSNDCTSGANCNGTQYAPINANGTIGAWNYSGGGSSCSSWAAPCSSAGNIFNIARSALSSVAYNGNLYVIGGGGQTSTGDCGSSAICSGVQFVPLSILRNSAGPVGAWNYTHNSTNDGSGYVSGLIQQRGGFASIANNGYIYVLGGFSASSGNDCTGNGNRCSGVLYAPINSDGTLGVWHYTHNSTDDNTTFVAGFSQPRSGLAAAVYNGYLYIGGGFIGSLTVNDCSTYCNGVQYAQINSNGTVGAWHYTHNSTDDNTTFVAGFNVQRSSPAMQAYSGYLYVFGGSSIGSSGDCTVSNICNGVQYAQINSNGTVGAWHYTHNSTDDSTSFVSGYTQPRTGFASTMFAGFIYVIGGASTTSSGNDCTTGSGTFFCNGVQYAKINSNGTVGAWHYTSNNMDNSTTFSQGFKTPRQGLAAVANKGYIYITGGNSAFATDDCTGSGTIICNGIQFARINSNGTLGPWHFTHGAVDDGTTFVSGFTKARYFHGSVSSGGRLYIIAGTGDTAGGGDCDVATHCNGVEFAAIFAGNRPSFGTDGTWAFTHNSTNDGGTFSAGFMNVRSGAASVAYNGYIYLLGGSSYSDVQYAKLNSDGTVGVWHYTHNSTDDGTSFVSGFTLGRSQPSAAAYNGYIYILGGSSSSSSNDCTYGTVTYLCTGVQYAKLNSDGTVGVWHYTHNSTDDGTSFVSGFTLARDDFSSVVYNGYIYILGGQDGAGSTTNDCIFSNICNGVQFAKINADGTVGAWHYTHNSTDDNTTFVAGFTQPRFGLTSVAYNGYLYVLGGNEVYGGAQYDCNLVVCFGVQYAKLNSDGTVGAWHYTHNSTDDGTTYVGGFTKGRYDFTSTAYNGYLYIGGGQADGNTANDCNGGYCNGVQYAPINSDGTVGAWHYTHSSTDDSTTFVSGFAQNRYGQSSAVYNGYLYILGGSGFFGGDCTTGSATPYLCNGVQFTSLNSLAHTATFEKIVDLGTNYTITNISFSGQAPCGAQISYRYATSVASFGSTTTISSALPNINYPISQFGRYVWVQLKLNDSNCGGQSQITDFTVSYNYIPAAPTLSAPANSATNITNLQFQLSTTDTDSDYLEYKIALCTASDCSLILATIDQTSSQIGWSGQDQQTGTAYTGSSNILSSTMANYTYTGALNKGTQYWWQAYAIDPGGSNRWSPASSINTFTTGDAQPAAPTLLYPTNTSVGNSVLTTFQLRTTESNSDYVKYWIDVCSDSSCNTIVRSICQTNTGTGVPDGGSCTPTQTGWASQNTQLGTAYTASPTLTFSQIASHSYQSPYLTKNTTYYWRAYAIDPGGSNTWSSASSIQSFTTALTETHIQGGVKFQGSVKL